MYGAAVDALSELIEDDDWFENCFDEEMDYLEEWIPEKIKMAYNHAHKIGNYLIYALVLKEGFLDRSLIEMQNTEHVKWFYCKRQKVFLTSESE